MANLVNKVTETEIPLPGPGPELPLGLAQLMVPGVVLKQRRPDGLVRGCRYDVFSYDQTLLLRGEELRPVPEDSKSRAFKIVFYNSQNTEIAQIIRPLRYERSKMTVKVLEETVSIIREKPTCLDTVLNINDAEDMPEMRLKGIVGSQELNLLSCYQKNLSVGSVKRSLMEYFPTLQQTTCYCRYGYTVSFPINMHVNYKVAVFGATILADFLTENRKKE